MKPHHPEESQLAMPSGEALPITNLICWDVRKLTWQALYSSLSSLKSSAAFSCRLKISDAQAPDTCSLCSLHSNQNMHGMCSFRACCMQWDMLSTFEQELGGACTTDVPKTHDVLTAWY